MCPKKVGCRLEYCPLPVYNKKTKLCSAHNKQFRRTGDTHPIFDKFESKKCKVPDCKRNKSALRLCNYHYIKLRSVMIADEEQTKCEFGGCTIVHYAKGLCHLHYQMSRYKKDFDYFSKFAKYERLSMKK